MLETTYFFNVLLIHNFLRFATSARQSPLALIRLIMQILKS